MKKLISMFCACVMMFTFVSAGAVDVQSESDSKKVLTASNISSSEFEKSSKTILLKMDKPVTITYPDGSSETFTLNDNQNVMTRAGKNRINVTRSINRLTWDADLVLWADCTWGNRQVTILDKGLSVSTWMCELTEHSENITVKSASNNNYAKVRATGLLTRHNLGTGDLNGTVNYDFELWADPANSSQAYIHINDYNN